ncbi:MAG: hypothetical protein M3Y33_09445 [Actinomycetota bacterium]|nr:hypothetical protein [Actinomycetota bacterium]
MSDSPTDQPGPAGQADFQPENLARVQREHPSYDIGRERNEPIEYRFAAVAKKDGVHPACVISGDLEEMEASLMDEPEAEPEQRPRQQLRSRSVSPRWGS